MDTSLDTLASVQKSVHEVSKKEKRFGHIFRRENVDI